MPGVLAASARSYAAREKVDGDGEAVPELVTPSMASIAKKRQEKNVTGLMQPQKGT